MVLLCVPTISRRAHIRSCQPSLGGASGIKTQSAPDANADTNARYLRHKDQSKSFVNQCKCVNASQPCHSGTDPQCRPMTSRIKVRWWLWKTEKKTFTIRTLWTCVGDTQDHSTLSESESGQAHGYQANKEEKKHCDRTRLRYLFYIKKLYILVQSG